MKKNNIYSWCLLVIFIELIFIYKVIERYYEVIERYYEVIIILFLSYFIG